MPYIIDTTIKLGLTCDYCDRCGTYTAGAAYDAILNAKGDGWTIPLDIAHYHMPDVLIYCPKCAEELD